MQIGPEPIDCRTAFLWLDFVERSEAFPSLAVWKRAGGPISLAGRPTKPPVVTKGSTSSGLTQACMPKEIGSGANTY
jgi:hypothetical protein